MVDNLNKSSILTDYSIQNQIDSIQIKTENSDDDLSDENDDDSNCRYDCVILYCKNSQANIE